MIVLAMIGLMAGLLYPTMQNQLGRIRTMTSAKQIASVFQRARLEAIRRNTAGIVEVVDRRVEADVDGVAFTGLLSDGVEFGAPSGQPIIDGFGHSDQANFTIAGSVRESGAFRIVGPRGNFVEIRVDPPATARVQIRKWDGSAFKARGEGGVAWKW